MNAQTETISTDLTGFEWDDVLRACECIPPLWSLDNYVAVNVFMGFSDEKMGSAMQSVRDRFDVDALPPWSWYRAMWSEGKIADVDLRTAARRLGTSEAAIRDYLATGKPETRLSSTVLTFAEQVDSAFGTHWHRQATRFCTLWLAAYAADKGASGSDGGPGLYESWRSSVVADLSMQACGMKNWRGWVRSLPETASAAIVELMSRLSVPADSRRDYFVRLFTSVFGWAAYYRRMSWEGSCGFPGPLVDVLAIRLCYDAAVAELTPKSDTILETRRARMVECEHVRLVAQEALEDGYVRQLRFNRIPTLLSKAHVQAVFCIDTRSEVLRRHLEEQSEDIQTAGFAGFFGIPLNWSDGGGGRSSARCPVLLKPVVPAATASKSGIDLDAVVTHIQTAPGSAYSFVELLGPLYGALLATNEGGTKKPGASDERTAQFAIEGDDHSLTDVAATILKNLCLGSDLARLVLLCGHESLSANNPHAASLDCGACGGHSGAINARIAAALLNNKSIRKELAGLGYPIPEETWFVAGVHNTTTDEVVLLDTDGAPPSHDADLRKLAHRLSAAGDGARRERARKLDPALRTTSNSKLLARLRARARDWSEVRPEWGLAGNAAFIAARRSRTRGVHLDGRSFLHEYDWTMDPDNSVLESVLSGPMVVASWINLQYFASTVDNDFFGCGTKTLHNRIHDLGVVLGNGGDLRTGLPLQSVSSGDGAWYHEPLRLQVVIEAPRERIEAALAAQSAARDLAINGWIRIFALSPEDCRLERFLADGWE